ncbi:MAG: ATP-binding protein, partial [Rhizomicrobium sp.]
GMDKAGLRKALEPYGQIHETSDSKELGTGLGLPIVKALIEAHGAVFHIESQRGAGTTVWGTFEKNRIKIAAPH